MSPASQGALEVERYIGSCLISSGCCGGGLNNKPDQQQRPKQQQQQNQFWAGGAPLVHQQQQQQQQQSPHNRVPLSRLAVHTQGAPLILSSQRYHNNNRQLKQQQPQQPPLFNNISRQPPAQLPQPTLQQQQRLISNNSKLAELKKPSEVTSGNGTSIDSLSVASDESSGSNNSENSLPRIIKPRKRRKKDRKPPLVAPQQQQQLSSPKDSGKAVEESVVVVVAQQTLDQPPPPPPPRVRSYSYDNNPRYDNYYRRGSGSINNRPAPPQPVKAQEVVDTRQQQQQQRFAHRHVQVKVLDDNRNVILPLCPKSAAGNYLRQPNAAGRLLDECGAGECRYCDPATLIWDVADQASFPAQYLAQAPLVDHHRAHHHHHHHHRYAQVPVFLTARPIICRQDHVEAYFDDSPPPAACQLRLRPNVDGSAAMLRRSWSDPTSYFGDEVAPPSRDVGVIGDRGGQEKSKNPWRGDALSCGSSSPVDQPASPTNSSSDDGSPPAAAAAQLRVSTEIVTSANGHRDLEIKFYSSSHASEVTAKSAKLGFPSDEADNEEFSDIWSYHESKLQQDFRTLLQAGED